MDRKGEIMGDTTASSGFSGRGLEQFRTIDRLVVKHSFSCMEALCAFAMKAKYTVFNKQGQQLFQAVEESTCCQRYWIPGTRGFLLHISDNSNQEIIQIRRECSCCTGCCWCGSCPSCMQEVTVECPPGNLIGVVK